MATTAGRLDVYNMALGYIGARSVASPDEHTPEAIQCEFYWDRARRTALRDFPYAFAQKRVLLAQQDLPDVYAGEWRYAYALPIDCLKVHKVAEKGKSSEYGRPFMLIGGAVLSDVFEAYADITADVKDVSLWDELFTEAMARKLACMIHNPLMKNNNGKLNELEQLYKMVVPSAEGQSVSERQDKHKLDSWLVARGVW